MAILYPLLEENFKNVKPLIIIYHDYIKLFDEAYAKRLIFQTKMEDRLTAVVQREKEIAVSKWKNSPERGYDRADYGSYIGCLNKILKEIKQFYPKISINKRINSSFIQYGKIISPIVVVKDTYYGYSLSQEIKRKMDDIIRNPLCDLDENGTDINSKYLSLISKVRDLDPYYAINWNFDMTDVKTGELLWKK